MLKNHFLLIPLYAIMIGLFAGSTPLSNKNDCDCAALKPNAPTLYKCNSKTKATEVRCILTRKSKTKGKTSETSYVFVAMRTSDKKRDLKINATINGANTLMYTGDIFTIDNRSSSNEYVVKINLWTQKGYTVEIRRDDFLKITFNKSTKAVTVEDSGYMKQCFDNNHTLTSENVKSDIFSRSFEDPDDMVGMAIAYFIYEYNKALTPQ